MALRPRAPRSQLGHALELGLEISVSVVLGVALGYYADRRFGTEPVFLIVFLLVGFANAIRTLVRFVARAQRSFEDPQQDVHREESGSERPRSEDPDS